MKFRNAYCTQTAFEEIFIFNEEHTDLYKIITKECQLNINLTKDELAEHIFKSISLKSFYKSSGKIIPSPEVFDQLPDKLDFSAYNGALFIVNAEPDKCENIRKKYGVLTVSAYNLEEFKKIVVPPTPWSWSTGERKKFTCPTGKSYLGWGAILRPFCFPQSLSAANLIINDDYLLKYEDHWLIARNIFSITKGFLSDYLTGEMQVLIVSGSSKANPGGFQLSSEKLDSILQKLNSLKAEVTTCKIRFGILTHDIDNHKNGEFHERFIIADYSITTSNWGFLEFIDDAAQRENDLNYQWIFYNISNNNGSDIPFKKMQKKIDAVKSLKEMNIRMNSTSTHFFRGHYENRLLNL
jgi:hypothetical protein